MVELDVPAMIHVSASCNPNFHATGAHYINADTTAFMQFIEGDLFKDFPTLRFIIPHGGGAVPYHWGRYRGLADMLKRPPLSEHVMKNVFFDTCVYHQPGIDLLVEVIDIDNILFGSEMVGAVRGIDPETGHYFDDTKRYIDELKIRAEDKRRIYELNARRVFPRLDAALASERSMSKFQMDADWKPLSSATRASRSSSCRPARSMRIVTCSVRAMCFRMRPSANTRRAMHRRSSCGRCAISWASNATSSCKRRVTAQTIARSSMHSSHSNDRARGVATVKADVSDAELKSLDAAGVRGVRFNFVKRLVDTTPRDVLDVDRATHRTARLAHRHLLRSARVA